jgi:hypothetical protein
LAIAAQQPRFSAQMEVLRSFSKVFPWQIVHFPCKYLRVPLSVHKLHKEDLQPVVDSVADHLQTWKSRLMSLARSTTLTKVTLSAILVHVSIAVQVSPWILKMVDKFRHAFIWSGSDTVQGSQCLVLWQKVARSVELGGLGSLT